MVAIRLTGESWLELTGPGSVRLGRLGNNQVVIKGALDGHLSLTGTAKSRKLLWKK